LLLLGCNSACVRDAVQPLLVYSALPDLLRLHGRQLQETEGLELGGRGHLERSAVMNRT
jgi:hypothetical protein